jgi:hypothetical protein
MRAHAPYAGASEIESALARTAGPVEGVRFGRIDARAALDALGQPSPRLEPQIVGRALVGRTLEAFDGIWAGAGVLTEYRWERCRGGACEAVSIGRSYVVQPSDAGAALRIVASAVSLAPAVSPQTDLIPLRPRNLSRPSISGRPLVGATLIGQRGTWSGTSAKFEVHWVRCRDRACRTQTWIGGRARYRVGWSDRGHLLRFVVAATNEAGSATASSRPSRRVG